MWRRDDAIGCFQPILRFSRNPRFGLLRPPNFVRPSPGPRWSVRFFLSLEDSSNGFWSVCTTLLHCVFDNPPCCVGLLQLPTTGVFSGHHPQPLSDLGHPGHLIFEGWENPKSEFLEGSLMLARSTQQRRRNATKMEQVRWVPEMPTAEQGGPKNTRVTKGPVAPAYSKTPMTFPGYGK